MPSFCRHNRLVQNCPICSREREIEVEAAVSHSRPRAGGARSRAGATTGAGGRQGTVRSRKLGAMSVRRLDRGTDDGYGSPLLPGLRSSVEAGRLASELSSAAGRLQALEENPPGLYREVADRGTDIEERTWLAFLIAFLCPLEAEEPFAAIRAARTSWAAGELPDLSELPAGPRATQDPAGRTRTLHAYRAWAARAGSQSAGFSGEPGWSPDRRFARAYERLALPGLHRDARFELLASLGCLGAYDLRAGSLQLGGENSVTVAAKRALGIGDPLLLERRSQELATACQIPLEALDLGFYNWEARDRATMGMGPGAEVSPEILTRVAATLGL
ncbi:MAG: hypothetical protein M3018_04290 [Actinomycetota bacterium]|nr:hypothetical protein [Actinomycetota bacterium]